ncbi:uncharacterized protein F4812DRAFT_223056 [Daldinia caldariorum]|uniref:uncharacterized protein n=1 Tax=Daldinia caldariorum TaxID=326644 RepID=UPI002007D3B4|nr:uncharacterized protein F4812DRAFT_223056 [Daldinia caldariorum]KAI1464085.1 hypothetical protein F4812DRAFT_223056 [Daldinia caldariorum]
MRGDTTSTSLYYLCALEDDNLAVLISYFYSNVFFNGFLIINIFFSYTLKNRRVPKTFEYRRMLLDSFSKGFLSFLGSLGLIRSIKELLYTYLTVPELTQSPPEWLIAYWFTGRFQQCRYRHVILPMIAAVVERWNRHGHTRGQSRCYCAQVLASPRNVRVEQSSRTYGRSMITAVRKFPSGELKYTPFYFLKRLGAVHRAPIASSRTHQGEIM